MSIAGLCFVITGGAVGNGAAHMAVSRGAKVVVSDMNDEPGQALVEKIRAAVGDTFEQVMAVNVTGAWFCTGYALPYLPASECASTINAGSTNSLSGFVNGAVWGVDGGSLAWRGTLDVFGMEAQA